MHEKENILKILKNSQKALEEEDALRLKELSDQTVHTAAVYQDPDNIAIAVLIYSLSKIIERKKYRKYKEWKHFIKHDAKSISRLISDLERNQEESFRKEIKHIRRHINTLSKDFKRQIQDVLRKAEINKASRIYEHGISMQRTADLLGISIWELTEYAGGTGVAELKLNITLSEEERIKNALSLFK